MSSYLGAFSLVRLKGSRTAESWILAVRGKWRTGRKCKHSYCSR